MYLEDQKKFVKLLDNEPKSQLLVRLASGSRLTKNSEDIQWKDFDSEIRVDDGFTNIRSLIQRSRLIIHSYDSTGLLETLSWNLPTIAFWQNGLEHLRDEVVQDFKALHDVGIVYFSATEAAQKVNEIWGDIDGWWNDDKIQNARKLFCSKYAVLNDAPLRKLTRLLREDLS
jgi:putative transferase (TIGR04331 family)